MQAPLNLLPSALSDLFAQVMISGKLTLADRYGLLAALLDEKTTGDDLDNIDRLLRSVRRGRVLIVEELSNTVELKSSLSPCWTVRRQHRTAQKIRPRR